MPLKVEGDPGYGSVVAGSSPVLAGSPGGSETVPLLMPEAQEPAPWRPLNREQLEEVAGGSGWRALRSRLILLFWLSWFVMLGAAIAIIVKSPRPVAPPLFWWQRALFYKLQPAALMQEDGEGASGISLVSEQLPYLQSLGVGSLLLGGVSLCDAALPNLTAIDPKLGTSLQLSQLLTDSRLAGVRIVLDLCQLNLFSGQEHSNDTEGLSDAAGYMQYSLRFWLEQGVSGFGICDTDAAFSERTLVEWRQLVQEFSVEGDERIVMVRQTGDTLPFLNGSVAVGNGSLVDLVTRTLLPASTLPLTAAEVAAAVETHLQTLSDDWLSWTVGGAVSVELQKVVTLLMMTLPGTPIIQHGEELCPLQDAVGKAVSDEAEDAADQQAGQSGRSLSLFQALSHVRAREEALVFGNFTFLPYSPAPSNTTATPPLAFLRSWGCVHFLVLFNLGHMHHTLDPDWASSLPEGGVYVTSTGLNRVGAVSLRSIQMEPHEALIIKLFEMNV